MLIAQEGIGSVLKQSWNEEDDDEEDDTLTESLDVFGVTTVLNLSAHQVHILNSLLYHDNHIHLNYLGNPSCSTIIWTCTAVDEATC